MKSNRMMKRLVCAMLLIVLAVTLCGCQDPAEKYINKAQERCKAMDEAVGETINALNQVDPADKATVRQARALIKDARKACDDFRNVYAPAKVKDLKKQFGESADLYLYALDLFSAAVDRYADGMAQKDYYARLDDGLKVLDEATGRIYKALGAK